MVSVTQVEGEFSFLSKNSSPEQSKGVKAHLYRLGTIQQGNNALGGFACDDQDSQSLLDTFLLCQWEDRAWKSQLGYDVTSCEIKVTDGKGKFVIQLNDKLNPLFLKEFGNKFSQPFGSLKSNYMKSYKEEVLLFVTQGENDRPELVPSTIPPKDGVLVIANVNPIEYGHVFLVPYATHHLPNFWDRKMFGLVTKIAQEVNSASFRVFFDYETSFASDHMYFQASYFANPLPVELFPTVPVYNGMAKLGIIISEVVDYPLKALVFMSKNLTALVNVVSEVQSLVTGRQLSTWECGGYFVYHTKADFDSASEMDISNRMASVSLEDGSFKDLKQFCCSVAVNLVI